MATRRCYHHVLHPYCIGKEYEKSGTIEDFIAVHKIVLPEIVRITRDGGSICWQVGYHPANRGVYPLDYPIFSILEETKKLTLRNRIIWTFGHGLHNQHRFSGRHETLLWFTKGSKYHFDLDAVRVGQKYPGKRHHKGPKKGEFSLAIQRERIPVMSGKVSKRQEPGI